MKKLSITRKMRKLSFGSLFMSLICLFLTCLYPQEFRKDFIVYIHLFLSLIFFTAFVILSRKYWRCPNCGEGYELRYSKMDRMQFCPFCKSEF